MPSSDTRTHATMSGVSFRGVSAAQDGRFGDKEKKLLRQTKFPEHFSTRVDISKVKMEAMMPWVGAKVTRYLGFEDEVVIGYIESQLLEKPLDPKKMQIALTGFLEKNTAAFMSNLWTLLLSAQTNDFGIPESSSRRRKRSCG